MNVISLRKLIIARLVIEGCTQKQVGKMFGITGCMVGVHTRQVVKRLYPTKLSLHNVKCGHKNRVLTKISEYIKQNHYLTCAVLSNCDDVKTLIKSIK